MNNDRPLSSDDIVAAVLALTGVEELKDWEEHRIHECLFMLKERHPELKDYFMFSTRGGQEPRSEEVQNAMTSFFMAGMTAWILPFRTANYSRIIQRGEEQLYTRTLAGQTLKDFFADDVHELQKIMTKGSGPWLFVED